MTPPSFDPAIYRKLCAAVTEAKVLRFFGMLKGEIHEGFGEQAGDADTQRLITARVHRVASTAGMLGFPVLSALCRDVEQTLSRHEDVADLLAELELERLRVLALIADVESGNPPPQMS